MKTRAATGRHPPPKFDSSYSRYQTSTLVPKLSLGTGVESIVNNFNIFAIDCVDIWSPKVVQASAGALALQTPLQVSWQEVRKFARERTMKIYAMVVSGGTAPEGLDLGADTILVLGSEAHGIPEQYVADCDGLVTLSMPGRTESLNAAIAGSIGMYVVVQKARGVV